MKRRGEQPRRRAKRPVPTLADLADRYDLYERAVQDTRTDIELMTAVFEAERRRPPLSLREDFCGTARLCADWVVSRAERTAIGVDNDPQAVAAAQRRSLSPLGASAERVTLQCQDVREAGGSFDVVAAFNFSYMAFGERRELLDYFRGVQRALVPDGVLFLDLYGGPEAQMECVERRRLRGFVYEWEQRPFDAVTHRAERYIHFRFPDGSAMERAFAYDWRLWTLPELRDLLAEAGYARSDVYWEGADERGRGNGVFRRVERVDNEEAWIAYLAAWR